MAGPEKLERIKLSRHKRIAACGEKGISSRALLATMLRKHGVSVGKDAIIDWDNKGWPVLTNRGEKAVDGLCAVLGISRRELELLK